MSQAAPVSQLGQLLAQQNGSTTAGRPMSPGRSDLSRDDSNMDDDSSSIGAKEEDEDDENDEDLEDNSGDPER